MSGQAVSRLVYIDPECGEPAFYLCERPEPRSKLRADIAQHLDGLPMEYGSVVCCGSCGRSMAALETKNIREIE